MVDRLHSIESPGLGIELSNVRVVKCLAWEHEIAESEDVYVQLENTLDRPFVSDIFDVA